MKNAIAHVAIFFIRLLALLPLPVARGLGGFLGRLMWWCNSDQARVTRINLDICFPNLSHEERRELGKQSMVDWGKTTGEMGMSWCWPVEKVQQKITTIEGKEYLDEALSTDNGIILIAPHLGNWEILNHFFKQYFSMTVMYKPVKIPAINDFIVSTRKRVHCGLVPANKEGVLALFDLLRNKKAVAVLPDQQPRPKSGVFAPFFGFPALTGKLIGDLANKTDAYLLCCYAKRLDNGDYSVVLKPGHPDIRSDDPVESATALNKSIEECVLDCPAQYQWGYKRFRHQPDRKDDPYRKRN